MMSGIRSKDTHPEMAVRRYLHSLGFRYRLHATDLPGKPDLVFPRYRAVVFVHGCFWHAHQGCRYFRIPATRTDFWMTKLADNATRDTRNLTDLHTAGWRVAIIWECALRAGASLEPLATWLRSNQQGDLEIGEPYKSGSPP